MPARSFDMYSACSSRRLLVASFVAGIVVGGAHCAPDPGGALRRSSPPALPAEGGAPVVDAGTDAEKAKALFVALQGELTTSCGGSCHEGGVNNTPTWLAGPDAYKTIRAYPGIVVPSAISSSLLTKGKHDGPPLTTELAVRATAWLTAEAALLAGVPEITTAEVPVPASGAAEIALPRLGGKISLVGSLAGGILSLKDVALVAAGGSGVRVSGIHLHVRHADGTEEIDQSLANAEVVAAKGQSVLVDIGLVVIPNVSADDKMRIVLDELEASNLADGGAGGCKAVATFQTTAAPALQAACAGCHYTGGTGNGALDLAGLGKSPADFAAACAQAKNKINVGTPAQSAIILAPTGGRPSHPFKNATPAFVTAMTTWIAAEK